MGRGLLGGYGDPGCASNSIDEVIALLVTQKLPLQQTLDVIVYPRIAGSVKVIIVEEVVNSKSISWTLSDESW